MKKIFLTGGSGFVGSHVLKELLDKGYYVNNFDIDDPYSTNPLTLHDKKGAFQHTIGDIRDYHSLLEAMSSGYDAIIHCAAIAAVDRSIKEPELTIETNVNGTMNVFNAAKHHCIGRIHYVSTDEVFGSINEGSFTENSPHAPRNPYAAGKAGAEAIATAWSKTYGIDVTISNTCNNFGRYQSLDKLIPRLTVRALKNLPLPIYGDGKQQREWIHVSDHAKAIVLLLDKGAAGERYCVGSDVVMQNITIVKKICDILDRDFDSLAEFVEDRPGHDLRYSIASEKIRKLGWNTELSFEEALSDTVLWYRDNKQWWDYFSTAKVTIF